MAREAFLIEEAFSIGEGGTGHVGLLSQKKNLDFMPNALSKLSSLF